MQAKSKVIRQHDSIEEVFEADVLCIGGGIAGLMAAIRASELGAKVIVAEKGNSLTSGRGGAGNDHFMCYIPEVHGSDMSAFIQGVFKAPKAKISQSGTSMKVLNTFFARSFDIVKLWDSWGIPMKYQGRWEFAGHTFPGGVFRGLKYEGQRQKRILTKKALDKGVTIINRTMVFDLLCAGDKVVGAIAIGTRENKTVVFKAKSIILGTGFVDRLYPAPVPGWLGGIPGGISLTGDGRAMIYRAGGELVGIEMPRRHFGPRYFARFGQATWVGVLRDPQDKPIGPYLTRPDRKYSDMTAEVDSVILEDYMKSGRGPVYMDCRGISDDDYDYMIHWLIHEGNEALVNHMKEEGIDPRKNPVEFGIYNITAEGKIFISEKAETSIKGLFAAGDESMGGIGPSATYGWIAGESVANYVKAAPTPDIDRAVIVAEERKSLVQEIAGRKAGPDWKEANVALQQIMQDYAGPVRTENMLNAGLSYIQRLKAKTNSAIMARNRWELMRCLETLNLMELGELVFMAAKERKETRGLHKRPDYPLTDPMLGDKVLVIRRKSGKPVVEWKIAE